MRCAMRKSHAAMWDELRGKILVGLNTSLSIRDPGLTAGKKIFAELRGHPNDFEEDKDQVGC